MKTKLTYSQLKTKSSKILKLKSKNWRRSWLRWTKIKTRWKEKTTPWRRKCRAYKQTLKSWAGRSRRRRPAPPLTTQMTARHAIRQILSMPEVMIFITNQFSLTLFRAKCVKATSLIWGTAHLHQKTNLSREMMSIFSIRRLSAPSQSWLASLKVKTMTKPFLLVTEKMKKPCSSSQGLASSHLTLWALPPWKISINTRSLRKNRRL